MKAEAGISGGEMGGIWCTASKSLGLAQINPQC